MKTGKLKVVLANLTLLVVCSRASTDAPAGWTVSAPAFDASLERSSNAQLIDRLQDLDMSRLNLPHDPKPGVGFAFIDDWVDLSAPDSSIRIRSPELRELVRRGIEALPALLEHVTDPRPSHLVFAVARPRSPDLHRTVKLLDVYDSRRLPAKDADGVNTGARDLLSADTGYAVKVGDLCYVAIGQIVNRRLFIFSYTGSGFDETGRYKSGPVMNGRPFGFDFVDSPVATSALAAAVRSDWHDLDPKAFVNSLRSDVNAKRGDAGALCRLLAFYPSEGREEVQTQLQEVLDEHGEVKFWLVNQIISSLAPFWWNDLGTTLSAIFKKAARQDRRFQSFDDTRQNPLATGTAEAIATCASLLIQRGDDNHLRAVLAEEVERLRQQRTNYGGKFPVAYDYHLSRCETLLHRLSGDPEVKPSPSEKLPPGRVPAGLAVTLAPVESAFGRWPMMRLRFGVSGIAQSDLAAVRIWIKTARDDTGFDLAPSGSPSFVHPAVGRSNDAVLSGNEPPSLDAVLVTSPGPAQRLENLKGYVELIVPRYDPAATVRVEQAVTTAGAPVRSAALASAGVTVTVFATETTNQALSGVPGSADGPQSYGAQPHFRGQIPKGAPASLFQEPLVTDSDIPLGIDDPSSRIVATEFVAADGTPLHYNHNGWYHASGSGGRRFEVYRLNHDDIANATLRLTLATGSALVRIPFDFKDVPLPDILR